ncbi:MAG: hypothetical protein ACD_71C00007G0002 [uncultured bacterium (gcode 4)]|uniref:Nucleotidyltransferase n=1 Tax=uncultured bacterium (gcode 4) TaxID=1234023 RepID=K1YPA9_9BACT|nr:MAG: hypothetical protein ACD_71C00007G0002 [uncultured bacterium (gcode 4)]
MNISSFVADITPSQVEIDQISTSWNAIRDTIKNWMDIVWDSFLTWSYKRKTKVSPIDDLDIFFNISAGNIVYEVLASWDFMLYAKSSIPYSEHSLREYLTYNSNKVRYELSPIKVLNAFKTRIKTAYPTTSGIVRNGQCITVYLSSYSLTIDCVPYMGVADEDFFLIPKWWVDLYWKKANPKIDEEKINKLNDVEHYNGKLKWVIKVLKYWNKYKNSGVSFKSYVLESLIYHALNKNTNYSLSYVEILKIALRFVYENVDVHRNIRDIPDYEYMYYDLDSIQKERLKSALSTLFDKLELSEDTFTTYLNS